MNHIFSSPMSIPPVKWVGWGFHPTKFELINYFLKPKILGNDEGLDLVIGEVKLCKFEPHKLLAQSKIKSDDYEGYFFCPRDFKYFKSQRSNRKTKTGSWKPTGKLVEIKDKHTSKVIGTKRTLVFYQHAHPKALKTAWVAEEYEYKSDSNLPEKRDFVLIKLKKNPEKKTQKNESTQSTTWISDLEGEPRHSVASDCENQNPNEMAAAPPCDESELTNHATSDFENQNLNEVLGNSPYPENELSFDIQNPKEITAVSTGKGWLRASDFASQISPFELGEWNPLVGMSFDFKIQSPYDEGLSFDFEIKHLEQNIYVQDPEEGKYCPLTETPLDFDFPNPSEPNMSTLEEFYCGDLMAASPKNHLALPMLPELNPQVM